MAAVQVQLAAQGKRKEKARIAARARRSQEASIIMEMATELEISQEKLRRIDKATIVKLAIDYISAHDKLCNPDTHPNEHFPSTGSTKPERVHVQVPVLKMRSQPISAPTVSFATAAPTSKLNQRLHALDCYTIQDDYDDDDDEDDDDDQEAQQEGLDEFATGEHAKENSKKAGKHYQDSDSDEGERLEDTHKLKHQHIELGHAFDHHHHHRHHHQQQQGPQQLQRRLQEQQQPRSELNRPPLYSMPKLTTASIFAPKTQDNANSYFLMIEAKDNGKATFVLKPDTEIQDEDDLTHLAPQAGDISISFETDPLDGITIDDLLKT